MRTGLGNTLAITGGDLRRFPNHFSNLELWLDASDTETMNTTAAADFNSGANEFLSSSSTDFNKTTTDFSFGGWFITDSSKNNSLIGKYGNPNDTTAGYDIQVLTNGDVRLIVAFSSVSIVLVLSSVTVSPGSWNFIVGVVDLTNDLIKISVNGSTFDTAAFTNNAYSPSVDFRIGKNDLNGYELNGGADNCFFYDKALTQSEVNALYNSGDGVDYDDLTEPQRVSLVSWWEMTEASGNRLDSHGTNDLTDNNTVGYRIGRSFDPVEDNDYVYSWADKSDNGYLVTNSTGATQPQYKASGWKGGSLPYVSFDGIDDVLNFSLPASIRQHTSFIAYYVDSTSQGTLSPVLGVNNPSFNHSFEHSNNTNIFLYGDSTLNVTGGQNGYYIMDFANDSDSANLNPVVKNGTQIGTTKRTNLNHDTIAIANRSGTTGLIYVAEVVIYKRLLSARERKVIRTYLNNKWNTY